MAYFRGPNEFKIDGDIATLILTDNHGAPLAETIIDAADIEFVISAGRWGYGKCNKEVRRSFRALGKKSSVALHRFLLNPSGNGCVDHINGNTLDNRRSNLRVVSYSANAQNRHGATKYNKCGVRGVHWCVLARKYIAQINVNGVKMKIGQFDDLEEAEKAVTSARRHYMPFSFMDQQDP